MFAIVFIMKRISQWKALPARFIRISKLLWLIVNIVTSLLLSNPWGVGVGGGCKMNTAPAVNHKLVYCPIGFFIHAPHEVVQLPTGPVQ